MQKYFLVFVLINGYNIGENNEIRILMRFGKYTRRHNYLLYGVIKSSFAKRDNSFYRALYKVLHCEMMPGILPKRMTRYKANDIHTDEQSMGKKLTYQACCVGIRM